MSIIAIPLGWIMKGLYYVVKNYGIALLLFTFVTRLIVFPLAIKQQKSTAKMALLTPELEKIKKKYGKNQQKMQEEQMALYAKTGINPMASCLPMIVTMVILFALIPIIYGPLTYISNADKDELNNSNNLIAGLYVVSSDLHSDDNVKYVDEELEKYVDEELEKQKLSDSEKKELKKKTIDDLNKKTVLEKYLFMFEKRDGKTGDDLYTALSDYYTKEDNCKNASKALKDEDKLTKKVNEAIKKHTDIDAFMLNEEYISKNLVTSRPELMTFSFVNKDGGVYADVLPDSVVSAAKDIDYKSFGLDMGVIPSFKNMTWIIPFASFILQIAVTIVSQIFQKKNNPAAAKAMGMGMKITFIILPVFSLWIGFSYPSGLGLYWCYSSLFALLQTIVLNVIYNPAKVQAMVEAELEKNKKNGKKSMFAKMAEQNLERMGGAPVSSDDDDEDTEEKKLSKAEKAAEDRRRIAAARKRMAEKYGEEYQEFADEEEEEKPKQPQSGKKKKNKNKNNNNNNNNNNGDNKSENADNTESDEPAEAEQDTDAEEE